MDLKDHGQLDERPGLDARRAAALTGFPGKWESPSCGPVVGLLIGASNYPTAFLAAAGFAAAAYVATPTGHAADAADPVAPPHDDRTAGTAATTTPGRSPTA